MIVDIFMPHMRGLESIRIFHQRAPTVPLIAMSGYDLNADVLPPAKPIARSASRR
jgi:CheY-like chemotaxis protein